MDKHYTPKIEEFHVGFEYYIDGENRPRVYRCEFPQDERRIPIVTSDVRVKYLDKSDIESCGFVKGADSYRRWDSKATGEAYHEIRIYSDYIRIVREVLPNGVKNLFSNRSFGRDLLFRGIIKNKSELKVLLKQLGIDG